MKSRYSITSTLLVGLVALASLQTPGHAASFDDFVDVLREDARKAGISRKVIAAGTSGLKPNRKIIPLTKKQPEFLNPVGTYLSKRVKKGVISVGRKRVRKHTRTLKAVEKRYGVDRFVVAAIWGLETSYGGYTGRSDVLRALATLGWVGYRGDFFRKQFVDALHIMQDERVGRKRMIGSWAGGLGQTQFIPSSYRAFAVDFDGDGRRDLWRSVPDALGSAAHYLIKHGWQPGEPWGYPVALPKGFARSAVTRSWAAWRQAGVKRLDGGGFPGKGDAMLFFPSGEEGPAFLVTQNYWAIRDYNWSDSYVLSVTSLSAHLSGKPWPRLKWPTRRPLLKPQRQQIQRLLAENGFSVPNNIGRITREVREAIRDYQLSRGMVADGHPDAGLLKALERE